MSREPTRHQISSKLAYEQKTPSFLLRLQRKVAGRGRDDEEEEYENENDEFEDDGSGRPPIPRRPAIPQRPDDDPGSADEDVDDEKPQVVVLKAGKHLSEREAENEKRKALGLPPLADPPPTSQPVSSSDVGGSSKKTAGLTFSSGSRAAGGAPSVRKKRKAVGELVDDGGDGLHGKGAQGEKVSSKKKKTKKSDKKLLSFGDDGP